jgi:hypothetical protein
VFGDRSWYVDRQGVTQVADWPTTTPDESLEILEYFPDRKELIVSCDSLVFPGTVFTDSRFDGTLIARDVEQLVGPDGVRARVWCATSAVTRAMSAFTNMVRALSGRQWLRSYRARVVSQDGSGALTLQMVNAPLGTPDMQTKPMWVGCQGDSATVLLSSECEVGFQEGDPSLPRVSSWAPGSLPLTRTVDATVATKIGPSSVSVQLAGGVAGPVVLNIPYAGFLGVAAIFGTAMATGFTAIGSAMTSLAQPAAATACGVAATAATAFATACGTYASSSGTTKVTAT